MPPFYCDYCDVFLTHNSSSVRKSHNVGRNHLQLIREHYQRIYEEYAVKAEREAAAAREAGINIYGDGPQRDYFGQLQFPAPPVPLDQLPRTFAFPPQSSRSTPMAVQAPLNVIQPGAPGTSAAAMPPVAGGAAYAEYGSAPSAPRYGSGAAAPTGPAAYSAY